MSSARHCKALLFALLCKMQPHCGYINCFQTTSMLSGAPINVLG